MSIQLISVSYKSAPIAIREKFAFCKEAQRELMEQLVRTEEIEECILVSTCNRTELYCYGNDEKDQSAVFAVMQKYLLLLAGLEKRGEVRNYLRFFHNQKAVHHLFQVAAGLDSMVIGEDQILGQIKDAHEYAMETGTTGVYLNTLFRYAITGAKKVKTETKLSKTSVSTASLAIKTAMHEFGDLNGKKILIIGASGKIGSIVLKNLQSVKGVSIYVTARQGKISRHGLRFEQIPYEERYEYFENMDVIISATSSPHYTVTEKKFRQAIKSRKKKVLIDLAVPMDMEKTLESIKEVSYYNIDDFERISRANNEKKRKEAKEADIILDDYEEKFEQWRIFKNNQQIMDMVCDFIEKESKKKNTNYAVWKLFYQIRDSIEPGKLETFFQCLNERNQQWED
ncbi:MAG: glutamyl-tRNA reductase [Lachnospiraceae bacterium]|nr:glutamyl-tRNA reductase [Lachnospiraceae bacterium]